MKISRKAVFCVISIVLAMALTASGMHAHGQNSPAGLYRQMPGVLIGLLWGFALDSQILVVAVTVAANTCFYYLVLSFLGWGWSRFHRAP
jgi:hypothetical protein